MNTRRILSSIILLAANLLVANIVYFSRGVRGPFTWLFVGLDVVSITCMVVTVAAIKRRKLE